MSIIRKITFAIVAISALTVMAPSQAETQTKQGHTKNVADRLYDRANEKIQIVKKAITNPFIDFSVSVRDLDCLARNIYYEAGLEPEEGKAAVGIVTINRVKSNFATSICGVVNQRTTYSKTSEIQHVTTERNWYGNENRIVTTEKVVNRWSICQFSWACSRATPINDERRWEESQRVAANVLTGEYEEWQDKYESAKYFHNTHVRPSWAHQKQRIDRVGGHVFYSDK